MPESVRTLLAGALVAASLILLAPAVLADAELIEADPAAGSEIPGPFDGPILLTFSQELAENSGADLLDADRTVIAEATIPANEPAQMIFELDAPLPAGDYRIEVVSVAQDGHIIRPVVEFTVLEPEPVAEPTPEPTDRPSDAPSLAATPVPTSAGSPSPTGDGTPAAGTTDVLFPILAVVIAVIALAYWLLRNQRATRR